MNREEYKELFRFLDEMQADGKLEYSIDSPLAPYSTFRIGGPADLIVFPYTKEALIGLLAELGAKRIRHDVFGNGSNVLFADEGYRGVVIITTKMNQIKRVGDMLVADAGVSFTGLAVRALKEGLTGLEFAYGIPGSVGGAIYMNAGAYDGEVAQICTETSVYLQNDALMGEVVIISGDDQKFGYRTSAFQTMNNGVILGGKFQLKPGDPEEIKAKMSDLMFRRRDKQPLEYPSAGSTFKRAPGYFTAKLIDDAGLKGFSVGGAQVSEKHAGFVINRDKATSADVKNLIATIQKTILEKTGVSIECEVRIIEAE